jgi:hypothetical protein
MYFLDIRLVLFFSLLGRKEGRKKKKKKKRKQVQIDPSGPLLLMHGSEGSRDLFAGCVHKSYQSHHTDTKQQQHTGLVIYIRVYIYNILWGNQENDDPFGPPANNRSLLGSVAGRACCCVVMAVAILLSRFLNIFIRIQDLNGFPRSQEIRTDIQ